MNEPHFLSSSDINIDSLKAHKFFENTFPPLLNASG